MAEVKTNKNLQFKEFYNDLTNIWHSDLYVIEKITNLNLNECNFLEYERKIIKGFLFQKIEKFEDAFKCFQESNKIKENACAIFNLAVCYINGRGTDLNVKKGIEFYNLAIEKGNVLAIINLAHCYKIGLGVDENINETIRLLNIAIEKNSPDAINELAVCFQNEKNIKNIVEAIRLYKLAIKRGSISAIHNLALCYRNGEGVEKNFVEAIKLCRLYFEKNGGNITTLNNLIYCYEKMTFVERYEFYKSLPKNSPILERIKNENRYKMDCVKFDNLIKQETFKKIEEMVFEM